MRPAPRDRSNRTCPSHPTATWPANPSICMSRRRRERMLFRSEATGMTALPGGGSSMGDMSNNGGGHVGGSYDGGGHGGSDGHPCGGGGCGGRGCEGGSGGRGSGGRFTGCSRSGGRSAGGGLTGGL